MRVSSYSGLNYSATGPNPGDTVTYSRNSGGFPYLFTNVTDYSNTNIIQLTDPRGWGATVNGNKIVQAGFINDTETEDELWTIRGEVVGIVQSGLVENVVAGVAFNDRTKSRDITQSFLSLRGSSIFANQGATTRLPIPADALLEPTAFLGFLGFGPQVAYDPFVLLENGTYILTDVQSSDLPFPGDWTVNEKVYTGYLRADLDSQLGAIPMTGNIGVQLVFTDQSSSGVSSPGGVGAVRTPVSSGDSYAHVLPSMMLNFDVADNMKVRLGAARTLARPRMDQLNASSNASIANQPQGALNSIFSGSGGNPQLRPYVADGVDLSYEWYFGGEGYLAIAGYYKWLKDFVNPNAAVVRDFAYLVPSLSGDSLTAFNQSGQQTLGFVTGPDNGAEGHIAGIEATLALPFRMFAPGLDGFGFQTSVSYTDSELTVTPPTGASFSVDVPGLSKWVVNSTVYFEKSGFEARLSHRYRTKFLAEFIGISASRAFRETYPESIFDAQIGYRFQEDSALNGLSVTVQALNLTDEPFINFQNGDRDQIIDYERYGRTYLVGASYRF